MKKQKKVAPQRRYFTELTRRMNTKQYLRLSIVILVATTIFWSLFGALIHRYNSDEIVDPYLFESWDTFRQARFPGTHTFFLKWPIFIVISLFKHADWAYVGATILLCLVTVGGFAYLLSRFEKRPHILGTILLALSAALLLVPVEPYDGALLPVNMAMLATRNIEYLALLVALWLAMKAQKFVSIRTGAATVLLLLLFASDKLFVSTTLFAGVCLLGLSFLGRARFGAYRTAALRWVGICVIGFVGAQALLFGLNASHLTHITTSHSLGAYGFVLDPRQWLRAGVFLILGVLTNLGLNPLYDLMSWREIGSLMLDRLRQFVVIAFMAHIAATIMMVKIAIKNRIRKSKTVNATHGFLALLTLITLASFLAFLTTKHEYSVDARYVSIAFFCFFSWLTLLLGNTKKTISPIIAGFAMAAVLFALPHVTGQYMARLQDVAAKSDRNQYIIEAMKSSSAQTLMGNYWRVNIIKHDSKNTINTMATDNCLDSRDVLNSGAWETDLKQSNFAYLLTLDNNEPGAHHCSYDTVTARFGKPNYTLVVSGTQTKPEEILLFYEKNNADTDMVPSEGESDFLPKSLQSYIDNEQVCQGRTIMNIVAHQDDDILFMNPDLMKSISTSSCVRTVYTTAGDAGNPGKDAPYWLGRERGAQAAYAKMMNFEDAWTTSPLDIGSGSVVGYSTPRDPQFANRVSLVFFRLPDGNLDGRGFPKSKHESLKKLLADPKSAIHSVDGGASYNHDQLVMAMTDFYGLFLPTHINTQARVEGGHPKDHSDHIATGILAREALEQLKQWQASGDGSITLPSMKHYLGYTGHSKPTNVSGVDLVRKQEIFMAYAKYDNGVCQTVKACYLPPSVYGGYLDRQYSE